MKRTVFDMETGDPDDVFALCFITSHPALDLAGVTVTPGSDAQIGIVKHILERTDHGHVPVGSRTPGHDKDAVSRWHYNWLGNIAPAKPDGEACDVIAEVHPSIVITGAAVTNLARTFQKYPGLSLRYWVAQGGFAGENVVPEENRLEKFKGMVACPTYNFNGDPKAALYLLENDSIFRRFLVSKNVCHGVKYDKEFHKRIEPHKDKSLGLKLIYNGMSKYLTKKAAKAFHDPLAACVAVDPDNICEMVQVKMYREKGKWGANLADVSSTRISTSVNMDRFIEVLTTT